MRLELSLPPEIAFLLEFKTSPIIGIDYLSLGSSVPFARERARAVKTIVQQVHIACQISSTIGNYNNRLWSNFYFIHSMGRTIIHPE